MRLVAIVWRDSGISHETAWMTAPQIQNRTPLVRAVGYVVHEDEDNITLAMGHCADLDLYYGVHTVWKPSVKSIRDIADDHSRTGKEAA